MERFSYMAIWECPKCQVEEFSPRNNVWRYVPYYEKDAATDDVAVQRYAVFVNGKRAVTVPAGTTTTVLTRLTAAQAYTVTVRASDAAGNVVAYPVSATFTTLPAVVLPPLPH